MLYCHFAASPPSGNLLLRLSLGLLLLLVIPAALPAQETAKTYKTEYVAISYTDEQDLHTFTRNIATGMSFMRERPEKNPLLAQTRVDKIVDTVCSILDMRPLNLRFNVVLYKTQAEVTAAFKGLGGPGAAPLAFYSHGNRNIFLAIDSINDRILAHEIAHAVICIYFGVPPPERMQEVLAQYVDKHLWSK
ncbi:MAG: hypothetical protein U1C55_11270 [Smithellaceae bacterium]|nr:hypothetical protein [Smithellaceae bacterium]